MAKGQKLNAFSQCENSIAEYYGKAEGGDEVGHVDAGGIGQ